MTCIAADPTIPAYAKGNLMRENGTPLMSATPAFMCLRLNRPVRTKLTRSIWLHQHMAVSVLEGDTACIASCIKCMCQFAKWQHSAGVGFIVPGEPNLGEGC